MVDPHQCEVALLNTLINARDAGAGRPGVSDIIIPGGMNGLQLIEQVRQLYPAIATLAATGYSENALERPSSARDLHILPKPFKLDDLADQVAKLTK